MTVNNSNRRLYKMNKKKKKVNTGYNKGQNFLLEFQGTVNQELGKRKQNRSVWYVHMKMGKIGQQ